MRIARTGSRSVPRSRRYGSSCTRVFPFRQHSVFGDPGVYNTITGAKQLTSDLFWIRFQLVY